MTEKPYVVLARKHRPQTFGDVVGQDAVAATLRNAIAAKRLAHAYLFSGPRGVGKTTMARVLAKALNCKNGPTRDPCGQCDPCVEIAQSRAIDVLEMDAASHTGIDNVREVIIDTVGLAPTRDRYKVFIIDEAHMLSTPSFNALLKTLEEPPAHVVFILATTEAGKVPATVASRCQRFRFRPADHETIVSHLQAVAKKEKLSVAPEALALIARGSGASLRDAVSLLDQAQTYAGREIAASAVREMLGYVAREEILRLARALLGRDAAALSAWLVSAHGSGTDPAQIARDLREEFEGVFLERLGVKSAADPRALESAAGAPADRLAHLLRRLNRVLEELRASDSPRLTLELGLFGLVEEAWDAGDWVGRLEALEARLSAGQGPQSPSLSNKLQGAAASPAPASASRPAVPAGADAAWKKVIASVSDRPSLAHILAAARIQRVSESEWMVLLERQLELDRVERHRDQVEAALAAALGRKVALKLSVVAPGAAAEVVDTGLPEFAGGESAAGDWKDVTQASPEDNPLKKAERLLGGTARFVRKRSEE